MSRVGGVRVMFLVTWGTSLVVRFVKAFMRFSCCCSLMSYGMSDCDAFIDFEWISRMVSKLREIVLTWGITHTIVGIWWARDGSRRAWWDRQKPETIHVPLSWTVLRQKSHSRIFSISLMSPSTFPCVISVKNAVLLEISISVRASCNLAQTTNEWKTVWDFTLVTFDKLSVKNLSLCQYLIPGYDHILVSEKSLEGSSNFRLPICRDLTIQQ